MRHDDTKPRVLHLAAAPAARTRNEVYARLKRGEVQGLAVTQPPA